jgi:hypothetical protein
MAKENTHSMVVAGAGQTAAGVVEIGQVVLPAGGPWKIHNVFGLLVRQTATAGELNGGQIELVSLAGDIDPNPAPAKFPLNESPSFLGATADAPICELHNYATDWAAAGKAIISLRYNQQTTVTVAPKLVLGVMFGKETPAVKPAVFMDTVRAQVTAATETSLGTITLSERATMITGVMAIALQDGVLTAGEELIGYVRLASDDVDLTPMQIPFAYGMGAGLGATVHPGSIPRPLIMPCAIPLEKGSRVQCFANLSTAVTNGAEILVAIQYE